MWGQGSKMNIKYPEPQALEVDQRPGQVSKTFLQWDGTIGCKLVRFYYTRSSYIWYFIEFGQPPFPRSDTLSQSGPLKYFLGEE